MENQQQTQNEHPQHKAQEHKESISLKRLRDDSLLNLENLTKSPRSSSSFYVINHITALLEKHSAKIQESIDDMKAQLQATEHRLLNEIDKRVCDLQQELVDLNNRVSKVETVAEEYEVLKREIRELKIQSLRQENSLVACDVRINGIPYNKDENLAEIFSGISNVLKIETPSLKSLFRLQNKNNTKTHNSTDGVIMAKFLSPYDKNFFLKSYSKYKKQTKTNLKLKDIGFDSYNTVYINENLSNTNYRILQEAVLLKKQKYIHSAYTFRGLVYVKKNTISQPLCIEHVDILKQFFQSNVDNNFPHN